MKKKIESKKRKVFNLFFDKENHGYLFNSKINSIN